MADILFITQDSAYPQMGVLYLIDALRKQGISAAMVASGISSDMLATDFPDRAKRVLHLLQSMHGGRDYTAEFGLRQKGSGPYTQQIALRFRLALERLGLNQRRLPLRADLFHRPVLKGQQLSLFGDP